VIHKTAVYLAELLHPNFTALSGHPLVCALACVVTWAAEILDSWRKGGRKKVRRNLSLTGGDKGGDEWGGGEETKLKRGAYLATGAL
jgi:hypothetical protein